ncbi:uncharacterized mitochondrial protein AtMg00860-like [Lycium ferocissimum]|uniref:uncharacterized mitochondrial protein AtMg00860-like n=1 Tax=Lycium ferocissimum TaxID=112874 RepID=UPI002815CC7D|nr:uncharacterized mitochondrial protein AtMg00860-like [Lycium ferocissimum]
MDSPVALDFPTESKEKHERHLRIVFWLLREKDLFAIFLKCEFWLDSVALLGHVVSMDGIMVDPKNIEAVKDWVRPTTVTEIHSFVGLASYFCRFVKGFVSIASHLTRLTQKEVPFWWSNSCEEKFQKIKTLLTTTSILALLVEGKDFSSYCSASCVDVDTMLM